MLIRWRFTRMVHPKKQGSTLMVGLVVSGGQDKLIYVHRPGETQPSHALVGHESNVNPHPHS